MSILSLLAAVCLLACGFIAAVASGASRDAQSVSPLTPLAALLVAAILLTLQAIAWIGLGTQI